MPLYEKVPLYEDLIEKKQKYIDAYLTHGDKVQAFLDAGYKGNNRTLRSNSYKLYRELQPVILVEIEKRIGKDAILALKTIRDLMIGGHSEAVRLAAAKDYLSRAGMDKPTESNLNLTDARAATDTEIDEQIKVFLKKASDASADDAGADATTKH